MKETLFSYCLHLADNALILGHRNSEWTGHGPVLEQDIALSNISLDLIGQARNFYQLACAFNDDSATEDDLAFLRNSSEYLNCLLVEQANGHWGKTIARQFLFSAYALPLYDKLKSYSDYRLAAIAEKAIKEVAYHYRWSSEWMIRLGQGTEESHGKMKQSIVQLWPFTEELITPVDYEKSLRIDFSSISSAWISSVENIMKRAGLVIPINCGMEFGGKEGKHSALLDDLLSEMQYMQRTYPGMQW